MNYFDTLKNKNFYTFNKAIFKRLNNYYSIKALEKLCQRKIKNHLKTFNSPPLNKTQIKEAKDFYKSFGFKNINTDWHQLFTHISGEFHKNYIPEDIFYTKIIPHLNMSKFGDALADKNLLNKLFPNVRQPKTVIKNVNGLYLNSSEIILNNLDSVITELARYSHLIIKPSIESGGGKSIIVFELKNGITDYKNYSLKDLLNLFGRNFIIQEVIVQNDLINSLNPSSVNTIRINSVLIGNKVQVLGKVMRVGGKDSKVDNTSSGGFWVAIKDNGYLQKKGYSKYLNHVFETNTGIQLSKFKVPFLNKVSETISIMHKQIPHFRYVAWDIALDKDGNPILIEYNVRAPGIDGQIGDGPLFGKFTENILSEIN